MLGRPGLQQQIQGPLWWGGGIQQVGGLNLKSQFHDPVKSKEEKCSVLSISRGVNAGGGGIRGFGLPPVLRRGRWSMFSSSPPGNYRGSGLTYLNCLIYQQGKVRLEPCFEGLSLILLNQLQFIVYNLNLHEFTRVYMIFSKPLTLSHIFGIHWYLLSLLMCNIYYSRIT